jgi:hypothetical protein
VATFGTRATVYDLINGNGRPTGDQEEAPDNPWAVKIVAYVNMGGRIVWGVVFEGDPDPDRYERETTQAKVIWERNEPDQRAVADAEAYEWWRGQQ